LTGFGPQHQQKEAADRADGKMLLLDRGSEG
jgi:hypothetical protein